MAEKQVVLMLRGLPGSGKSYYAHQLVSEDPERWVRVNKDSLREMLHEGAWSKAREQVVVTMQRALAESALASGRSVIVDDTNFAPKHEEYYRELAADHEAAFELEEFDTPVEECVARDLKRPRPVGKDVILKMHAQHRCRKDRPPCDGPLAVIVDLDGTLALMRGRGPFEWEKVGTDEINLPVKCVVESIKARGWKVLLVSGRDGCCEGLTRQWLADNYVPFDELWMRPAGNSEKDVVIKRQIYEEHVEGKYDVRAVFDDRPCVVRFWRSLGLFVFDCGMGYEF